MRERLPAGASLVEYIRFHPLDPEGQRRGASAMRWGDARYAACVLSSGGSWRCVDLGEAAAIDDAIASLRALLRDPRSTGIQAAGRRLYGLVFEPLETALGDRGLILLSPNGDLNLLPFGALVDHAGRHLIQRFEFNYLRTSRELVGSEPGSPEVREWAVFGDPRFDGGAETPELFPELELVIGNQGFRAVPETAIEAREVASLAPAARAYLGDGATEFQLKQVHSPQVLHLATHAFFISDEEEWRPSPTAAAAVRAMIYPGDLRAATDPLLRSGIVLAPSLAEREDGVVTALEAASLELTDTELVVLSACDTGVGEVAAGQGVYGLRRGFEIAGSASLLTSLWRVADDATRELMRAYYGRLVAGEPRSSAIRAAKLELLKSPARSHPFYWAAFIPSGDWRPLEALDPSSKDGAPVVH